jgi:hypothetical protein
MPGRRIGNAFAGFYFEAVFALVDALLSGEYFYISPSLLKSVVWVPELVFLVVIVDEQGDLLFSELHDVLQ